MEHEVEIRERLTALEIKLERHSVLSERVEKLWRWAMVLATVAIFLGIGGVVLLEKFDSARAELDEAEQSMIDIQKAMNGLKTTEIPSLVEDSKAELDGYTSIKERVIEKTFEIQLSRFFGEPIEKTLDQWHTASEHGFVRIQTGGSGGASGRAWVNTKESTEETSNRIFVEGFSSGVLIVRKGEKFRGELVSGPGIVSLVWQPISKPK